jgi:Cu-Zn family superoxide dismutase
MKTLIRLVTTVILVSFGLVAGCGGDTFQPAPKADAAAVLVPTAGNTAAGSVIFAKTGQGMRVIAEISNLTPGPHGIHVHEFGDCRAADAASAGGHFNPGKAPHGAPDAEQHHAGDLGNIIADASGRAKLDAVFTGLQLEGPDAVIGRSVVVHAAADDLKTQPTGASGARLACGVIGIAR